MTNQRVSERIEEMNSFKGQGGRSAKTGYTLIEVIVVLIILTVATAMVAPSLLSTGSERSSDLKSLLENARQASVRRGETVRLHIDRSGEWRALAGNQLLLTGRLPEGSRQAVDLVFSPLGTCAPAVESDHIGGLRLLDPLTCEARP